MRGLSFQQILYCVQISEKNVFLLLPIAGINYNGSGTVCIDNDGAVLPVHPHGLDTALVVVSEVETLVDPVVRQSLRVVQI